jgi:hypothetical protein
VNTADGQDDQGGEIDSFARPLLRTTSWEGHRPGAFERVLYQIYESLRPLIAKRLSEEHASLFAQPLTDPKTGKILWYATVGGEAVAYADLTPEDQAGVDVRVNKLLFDLLDLARKLEVQGKTLEEKVAGQLLHVQLDGAYTEKECLYVVGYQPVIAFWAFESGFAPNQFTAPPRKKRPAEPAKASVEPAEEAVEAVEEEEETTDWLAGSAAPEEYEEALPARPRTRISTEWSPRTFGILAVVLALAFFAIFGLSPRGTVIDWLDRLQTLRAREQALLRIIARSERARTEGVSEAELNAEVAAAAPMAEQEGPANAGEFADEGFFEPVEAPLPPFDTAQGAMTLAKLAGSVVLLHYWTANDAKSCAEITSFVSMVSAPTFETLREQGAEAYLVTTMASPQEGNEQLRACGVQDPLLLRDADARILQRLSPGVKPPVTVVYDKEDERTLATYAPRNWADAKSFEELRQLFLMRIF